VNANDVLSRTGAAAVGVGGHLGADGEGKGKGEKREKREGDGERKGILIPVAAGVG
jgi:hypothetical protein